MKNKYKLVFSFLFFIVINNTFSQIKHFGKVTLSDFNSDKNYTKSDAYVIFKNRETHLEFYNMEGWKLVTTVPRTN